jgi:hypothetical protein
MTRFKAFIKRNRTPFLAGVAFGFVIWLWMMAAFTAAVRAFDEGPTHRGRDLLVDVSYGRWGDQEGGGN